MRPISPKRLARLEREGKRLQANSTLAAPRPSEPRRATRRTDPDQKTRHAVLIRDGYACVRCGQACGPGIRPYSIHHRIDRSLGGTNELPNLLLLDGTGTTGCHGEVGQFLYRDWLAGYWLRSWQDPREVPVLYFDALAANTLQVEQWYLHSDGSLGSEPE